MNERELLLKAICADPDDDTPRLIYADWLEENAGTVPCPRCDGGRKTAHVDREKFLSPNPGGYTLQPKDLCAVCSGSGRVPDGNAARAEFVRVQCEIASVGLVDSIRGKLTTLRRREGELLETTDSRGVRNRMLWMPAWTKYRNDTYWQFRRGFVESLTCTAADWLAYHEALCWHPGQTVPCPQIKWRVIGGTVHPETHRRLKRDGRPNPCPDWCEGGCKGKGTVPRPFVATAQPITTVTLSDLGDDPDGFCIANAFSVTRRDGRSIWTSPRWRGVTFHLPG